MRKIIARGRHVGKSTITDIQSIIVRQQSLEMAQSIDKMIIDEIWGLDKYCIRKSWTDRRGRQMHRITANDEVREWLDQEHSQLGVSNPDWWKFQDSINITNKLLTLLVLRFAE